MQIENPDALKIWLTAILEPLCDADPAALARYVLALLKKDKPPKELVQCMLDQLDVFLGAETRPFLDKLMTVIKSKEYIQTPLPPTAIATSNSSANTATPTTITSVAGVVESASSPTINVNDVKTEPSPIQIGNIVRESTPPPTKDDRVQQQQQPQLGNRLQHSPIKGPGEGNTPTQVGRRRSSARNRSRSRSRSGERGGNNAMRSKMRESRERGGRYGRNESPPGRRYERRAGKRSPPKGVNYSRRNHSRSRSQSPPPYRRSVSPGQEQDGRIQSQVGAVSAGIGKGQCRDFEEKGYCMRGETCPWDHGVDPVVLEDINNPALLTIQQQQNSGSQLREYNPDAPDLWNRQNPNFAGGRGSVPGGPNAPILNQFGRNPQGGVFRPGPGMNPMMNQMSRELIPVPVIDGGRGEGAKRRFDQDENVVAGDASGGGGAGLGSGPLKRKPLLGNRLGPRQPQGPSQIQQNCSLELRKVPRGLNSIAHLNNHFLKFGKIVNIHVNYENDPEAAIITFSTHAEANVAYRSTEAVLNNRFIKVFWHTNKEGGEGKEGEMNAQQAVSMPRKPFPNQYHLVNNNNPTNTTSPSSAMPSDATNSSQPNAASTAPITQPQVQQQATAIVATPAVQQRLKTNRVIRKKQQEAVQLAHGLSRRKQELLQEYLKQMKSALDLIDRAESGDQRAKLLTTVKELQESIEKLRKEIATEQAQIAAQAQSLPPPRKTKEQQQKELLDLELELIAQQQEGNDTTLIQKRIQELQRGLGIRPSFARPGPGGGSPANRTRVAPPGSTSVDRRPTTIFVAGFQIDDSDALLGHFKHFGEITKNILDKNVPSLIISYAIRGHAEQAMLRGRIFKEKPLQINWYIPNYVNQQVANNRIEAAGNKVGVEEVASSENNNTEESNAMAVDKTTPSLPESGELPSTEEELRLELEEEEEEEEDAESEDRSWRR